MRMVGYFVLGFSLTAAAGELPNAGIVRGTVTQTASSNNSIYVKDARGLEWGLYYGKTEPSPFLPPVGSKVKIQYKELSYTNHGDPFAVIVGRAIELSDSNKNSDNKMLNGTVIEVKRPLAGPMVLLAAAGKQYFVALGDIKGRITNERVKAWETVIRRLKPGDKVIVNCIKLQEQSGMVSCSALSMRSAPR